MTDIIVEQLPSFHKYTDWDVFRERICIYIASSDIPADRHHLVLLSAIDETVYKRLRNEVHPVLPTELTYDQMLEWLDKIYGAKKVFYNRQAFYAAEQDEGETTTQWLKRLESLVDTCYFDVCKSEAVRDRFICGLRSPTAFDRITMEIHQKVGSLEMAYRIAMEIESNEEYENKIRNGP